MRIIFSFISLLLIALPLGKAEAMTCESLIAEFRRVPISRFDLQEMHAKALAKAESGKEEQHNLFRQEVLDYYDAEIAMAQQRIVDLKAAFRQEFSVLEKSNYFSGARLVIATEISNMELDIREMQRERKQIFKLIPRPNILVRAGQLLTGAFRSGSQQMNEAIDPKQKRVNPFLSPMNPAGPNYQFPNEFTEEDDTNSVDDGKN